MKTIRQETATLTPPIPDQLVLDPAVRRQFVLDLLRSARRRVILSLFRCDDSRILDEIIATSRRRVDVKVLVTPRARGWNKRLASLVRLLKDEGVDVRQYEGPWRKYHAKYIVVDDAAATIGSFNFTRKCLEDTCDFLLLSYRPDLVSGLKTLFDFDWKAPRSPLPHLGNRLFVGPDKTRRRIIRLLDSARHRIRVIDHRVTDPDILLLLASKMREGVTVQVLGRGEVGEFSSHGKLMLVDDDVAMFGSLSLCKAALEERREVAVIVDDPPMVQHLSFFFDSLIAANDSRAKRGATPLSADDDEDDDDDDD